MREFKETKGDWQIREDLDVRSIIGTNEFSLCDVWYDLGKGFDTKEKGEANANLLAAAPELLEALNDLKISSETVNEWTYAHRPKNSEAHDALFKELEDSLERAKKAINKALGQ